MTTTTPVEIDSTADAFAERVFGAVLDTFDVFSMYIGEQLGLYRALADHGPLTRDKLSHRADIHARYAQEWLEQQATTGILVVDDAAAQPADRAYSLPVGHAEVLIDPDSLGFLAPLVRMVLASGALMPSLLDAYRSGGGVGWGQFGGDMRTGQAEMNRPWFLESMGTDWYPNVPDLHQLLSDGGTVADIAVGEGWSSIAIALAYPNATIDGYDIDAPSIESARRNAADAGVADRVRFHLTDVGALEETDLYDAVVGFEFIHDLPQPVEVLAAMRRMAKPGAPIVVMDENVPEEFTGVANDVEKAMYGFSLFICLPDGMAHQPTVATGTVIRPDTMQRYAREAGFADAEILPIDNDLWRFYRFVE